MVFRKIMKNIFIFITNELKTIWLDNIILFNIYFIIIFIMKFVNAYSFLWYFKLKYIFLKKIKQNEINKTKWILF